MCMKHRFDSHMLYFIDFTCIDAYKSPRSRFYKGILLLEAKLNRLDLIMVLGLHLLYNNQYYSKNICTMMFIF